MNWQQIHLSFLVSLYISLSHAISLNLLYEIDLQYLKTLAHTHRHTKCLLWTFTCKCICLRMLSLKLFSFLRRWKFCGVYVFVLCFSANWLVNKSTFLWFSNAPSIHEFKTYFHIIYIPFLIVFVIFSFLSWPLLLFTVCCFNFCCRCIAPKWKSDYKQ